MMLYYNICRLSHTSTLDTIYFSSYRAYHLLHEARRLNYLHFSTPYSSPVPAPVPGSLIRTLCVIGQVGSGVQTVATNIAKALNKHDSSSDYSIYYSIHTLDFSYILSDITSTTDNSSTDSNCNSNTKDNNTTVYTRLKQAVEALVHDIHTIHSKYSQKSTSPKKDIVIILTIILSPIIIFRVPDLLTWLGNVTGCILEGVVTVDSVYDSKVEVKSGENRYELYMYITYCTIYVLIYTCLCCHPIYSVYSM